MRRSILAALLAASASAAFAAPTPKDQLLVPPADAAHFVIVSTAGKHGDEYMWNAPDGRTAFRQSILLRGLIFETDETMRIGADGMPTEIVIRGVTPSGDAAENFAIAERQGVVDEPGRQGRRGLFGARFLCRAGRPVRQLSLRRSTALLAAGSAGLALLPSGQGDVPKGDVARRRRAAGKEASRPDPDARDRPDSAAGTGSRTESSSGRWSVSRCSPRAMKPIWTGCRWRRTRRSPRMAPATAKKFLTADARRPVLFRNVKIYDAEAERFVAGQNVVVADGKIVRWSGRMLPQAAAGARVIDGAGKTLVPGLWDSHMHVGDDFQTVSELALGVTSCRNPGGPIELEVSQRERRNNGTLLAPECFDSVIVDQKGPLVAQGSLAVSSLDETLAAVRKIKANDLTAVKFYTSMNPAWIPPAAKLAHELGLHVHGHIPAGMRTLDAINAGYDEITHIYFATMQAMPRRGRRQVEYDDAAARAWQIFQGRRPQCRADEDA